MKVQVLVSFEKVPVVAGHSSFASDHTACSRSVHIEELSTLKATSRWSEGCPVSNMENRGLTPNKHIKMLKPLVMQRFFLVAEMRAWEQELIMVKR
ncbi:hypothetical protein GWN49_08975 [Candidatus Bathyarchaeota archaeon]|nr:hypothetical protein [Candidatus Bathyarchaeota archaeon]